MRAGDRIAGRFEILERAASGGMGAVYRARDLSGGPDVALKLLHAGNEDSIARMQREGAALAKLEHPNVVRYVAHGSTDTGAPYVAMEWIEGETLGKRIARERMPVPDAVYIARRLASALGAAHALRIVHRDVKPSNVMLVDGRPVLVDFGVARSLRDASITATGAFIGTPSFMAPEQARGDATLGPPADVFALGCVLYRCLAGQNAFQGDDVVVVLGKVLLDEPPDLLELVPSLPKDVARLVHRMLAKDPQKRPQDGSAAERALEAASVDLDEVTHADISISVVPDPPTSTARSIGRDELKIVSVLLVGRVPTAMLQTARAIGERHGAHVEQLLDGTIVVSMMGRATITDQVARVARMALEMRGALPAKIVLATGRGTLRGAAPVGEVLDRAGGMLASADGTGIGIDQVTASLLGARFELGIRGERLLLLGERAYAEPARTVAGRPSPYVGRDRELAMLKSMFEQSVDERRAGVVLVTAPAGLGKSRLAHELVEVLEEPIEVWRGHGDTAADGSPLLVLGRVIRSAAGIHHHDSFELAREKLRARVAHAVPESDRPRVAAFLGEIARVPFDESDPRIVAAREDARLMGDQLTLAWLDLVGAETASQPVLVVLDDMHWGDLPTVKMIDAALRTHRDAPLFVVVLARPEIEERFPRLFADREVVTVPLRELGKRGAETLAKTFLSDDALARRIAEQSAGNPLLLEELVRAAAESPDAPVPESAIAIVQARLEGLPEATRRLLRAASVQGTAFDPEGVAPLLGAEETAQTVSARLRDLADKEFVLAQPAGTWSFRHAIVRDVAYATLVEADRLLAHRLTAEWLAKDGDPAAVADHFERAGERAAAVPHLKRAAERSLEANDFGAVLAWAERAIACGATGEDRAALRMLQADACVWRGEDSRVETYAADARDAFPAGSRGWYLATGALGFGMGRLGKMDRVAALAEEILASEHAPNAEIEKSRAATRLCVHLMHGGRRELSTRLIDCIDAIAERHPDDLGCLARRAGVHSNLASTSDDVIGYLDHARQALELREKMGDIRNALLHRSNMGDAFIRIGAYPEAEEMLRQAIRQADHVHAAPSSNIARYNLGRALVACGRFQEALAIADDTAQRFERSGDRRLLAHARTSRSDALFRLGRFDEAARAAESAISIAGPYSSALAHAYAALARAKLATGDPNGAREVAEKAMAIVREVEAIDEGDGAIRLVHAEALRAAGDAEGARMAIRIAKDAILAEADRLEDLAYRETFLAKEENVRILAIAREP